MTTAKMLKEQVDQKRYVDVGSGVENHVSINNLAIFSKVIHEDQLGSLEIYN